MFVDSIQISLPIQQPDPDLVQRPVLIVFLQDQMTQQFQQKNKFQLSRLDHKNQIRAQYLDHKLDNLREQESLSVLA